MKTAEEWNAIYRDICMNDPAVHGQILPNPQNTEFIQRVQLDARIAELERKKVWATNAQSAAALTDVCATTMFQVLNL